MGHYAVRDGMTFFILITFLFLNERFVDAQEVRECDVLGVGQSSNRVFHGVINNILNLKLVFVVRVRVGEVTELLCQLEAMGHCFG